MKKLLCAAAAAIVGFSAFAEGKGGLAFTIDTRAAWDSENGLELKRGEDDFYLELLAEYEAERGGGMFRLRNDLDKVGFGDENLHMDRWEGYIKPNKYFKVSLGNNPIELYTEAIRWDAIAGAGIFESAGKHVFAEVYPSGAFDGLTIGGGVLEATEAVGTGDAEKPQYSMAAWATYEFPCVGSLSLTYEALSTGIAWETGFDGDAKRFGAIFDYNGIDNFEAILAYAGIYWNDGEDIDDLVQNRIDFDARYSAEKYSLELFSSTILRNNDALNEAGHLGERLAFKGEYYLSDLITPWIRVSWFKNYTAGAAPAWGAASIYDTAEDSEDSLKDEWALIVEPRVTFDFGKGVSAIVGFDYKHYTKYDAVVDGAPLAAKKDTWAIPVEFIIKF